MNRTIVAGRLFSVLAIFAIPCGHGIAQEQDKRDEIDPIYLENENDSDETRLLKERIRAAFNESMDVKQTFRAGEES